MKVKSIFLIVSFLIAISNNSFSKSIDNTVKNIKNAIIGETTASAKYAAYAKKAKEEGFPKIALLFEAASKAESIHANNHRAVLEELGIKMDSFKPEFTVKTTKENLEDAIKGETYEVTTMYPNFIKEAQNDSVSLALISFNYAYQTEKKHQALYKKALEQLIAGKENTLPTKYMVCTTCGNTYDGEAPARCGISMTPRERFITIQ
ncbi:rubrerythrin family protein [Melioribacteraceae bacterium 4301-Me]|uniref:rubrerythrin family protein n=1 Tax=Pyranulibacter aquaticus TaxID=3163344 RepID=UPI0035972E78